MIVRATPRLMPNTLDRTQGVHLVGVQFELVPADQVAFGAHAYRTTPRLVAYARQARTRASLVGGLLAFLAAILITRSPVFGLVMALAVAIVGWFVMWLMWPWQVRRAMSKSASGDALGDYGMRELTIDETGITESANGVTLAASWDSLKRFELSADHLFVWRGTATAFVIPTRIGTESVERIVTAIREHRPDLS
jgi:hypothetical protein